MTPTAKGAFCKACSKEVTDFSSYSRDELITYFTTYTGGSLCGRFRGSQLGTHTITVSPRVLHRRIPLWKKILAVLIICFGNLLFGSGAAYSQVADTAAPAKPLAANDTAAAGVQAVTTPKNMFKNEKELFWGGAVIHTITGNPVIFTKFQPSGKRVRLKPHKAPAGDKKKPAPVRRKKLPFSKPPA